MIEGPYGPPADPDELAALEQRLERLELAGLRRHLPAWSLARPVRGIRSPEPACG